MNKDDKVDVYTLQKILDLKGIFNRVSHASYSYAQLSKRFPIENIKTQTEAIRLLSALEDAFSELIILLEQISPKENRS